MRYLMKIYPKNFQYLFLADLLDFDFEFIFLLFLFLIICLKTFIKSFFDFLCKNLKDVVVIVIIKLNDKKTIIYIIKNGEEYYWRKQGEERG